MNRLASQAYGGVHCYCARCLKGVYFERQNLIYTIQKKLFIFLDVKENRILHALKMKKNQDCKNASSESLLIKICTTDKSHRSFILVINWETISCHHDSFQKINKCSFNSSSSK